MATDLIQRAAAICGIDNPNSDQLAAWLLGRHAKFEISTQGPMVVAAVGYMRLRQRTMLEALAAAVVEVDRIEREEAK